MAKNWIKGAIKHPGALTKKADAAGMSPMAFARKNKDAGGTTGKQANLALTLQKMHGHQDGGQIANYCAGGKVISSYGQ
jgi:hypothetical protein